MSTRRGEGISLLGAASTVKIVQPSCFSVFMFWKSSKSQEVIKPPQPKVDPMVLLTRIARDIKCYTDSLDDKIHSFKRNAKLAFDDSNEPAAEEYLITAAMYNRNRKTMMILLRKVLQAQEAITSKALTVSAMNALKTTADAHESLEKQSPNEDELDKIQNMLQEFADMQERVSETFKEPISEEESQEIQAQMALLRKQTRGPVPDIHTPAVTVEKGQPQSIKFKQQMTMLPEGL